MSKKYCYLFTEGNANMRELLGGKGANLAEMTNIGLPVPQGFTITTEACTQYYEDGRQINDEIFAEIMEYVEKMEKITGKKFGDLHNPLLVSVRSGARASMPGMMDTILNLGLNEDVVNVIAEKSNNPRWAWDCYRRFIQMYSDVVMEVGKKYFEQLIDQMKEKKGVTLDVELTADDLKELAGQFKAEYKAKIGEDFPTDPKEQLMGAIKAVFRSWDNPRANVYRRDNDIPYSWGTAVNVQSMAFGNMGDDCGIKHYTFNIHGGTSGILGEMARLGIEASRQTTVNLPSRIRMATLYAIAQSVDAGIVVNTSNLSEDWVGYCTIYGDSAGAFSPIGMYTTEEVIAIGRALGLPERFLIKPPSDGLTGKTDEDNLGFSYHAVNEYVRKGVADPAIKEQIDHKHRVSRFKFETIPVYHNGLPIVIEDGTDFYK